MEYKQKGKNKEGPDEILKLEIAKELGLLEKVIKNGWGSLTAQETGRIGGIITHRKQMAKASKKKDKKPSE